MSLKKLLIFILSWRSLVFIIALPAMFFVPLRSGFTYLTTTPSFPNLIQMWANFDGIHYFNLAKYGYSSFYTGYLQAFFPLYPILTGLGFKIFQNYLTSGLIISHTALVVALWYLYRLVKLDFSAKIANTTILLLLAFPTAFFFGCLYSESFFLMLSVMSFYYARQHKFWVACALVGLVSATRVTGILLLPAIFIEFFIYYQKNIRKIFNLNLLSFLLAPSGLLFYMRYLNDTVKDPLFFAHIQPLFGAQREVNHIVLLYQVFFRYAKMVIFINHFDPLFFTVLLELISGLLFLVLCIYAFKYTRTSYALYAVLSYLLPTLTGTFSSMPRYVLVLFPCFMVLSLWFSHQKPLVKKIYLAFSIVFSIFAISLFTRGYFIG